MFLTTAIRLRPVRTMWPRSWLNEGQVQRCTEVDYSRTSKHLIHVNAQVARLDSGAVYLRTLAKSSETSQMTLSARTPDQSWRSSRLATCTFGMPLECPKAGWYVTVGFDAALAMLFITATRFKMLDKSIPFIIGHVVPGDHGQIEGLSNWALFREWSSRLALRASGYSEMWAHPS